MIFNWGNLVIFVPTESEAGQEMETDDEGDEESDEVSDDEEPRPANPEAWTLNVIPQTPGIDHPVWQDRVSFADIGTMLPFRDKGP